MMSSVIPARLVFQCGHAALVSLPRIKGESNTQRAERVAREKSDAHTRACDFCAQRLEVVVQQPTPAPTSAPAPTPPPVVAPPLARPVASAETAPITPAAIEPAAAPLDSLPLAEWHAERVAKAKPRAPAKPKATPAATRKPVTRGSARNGAVAAGASAARNGRVPRGARFIVQFQAQTVLRATDMREALGQVQSLGAIEVLAITRESWETIGPLKIPVRLPVFPGSDEERVDLVAAVRRYCACGREDSEVVPDPCPPHDLLGIESTLKRLVFYRRWHRARAEPLFD
jgi:hypothetical protein